MVLRSTRLLVIVLLAGGCAGPVSPVSPERDAFPPTEQVTHLRLPFDAFTFSLADLYTVANAQDRLTHDCMKARGLDWEIIDRPTDVPDLRNRRRYGVVEAEIARRFGYHVPAGLLSPVEMERRYDTRERRLNDSGNEKQKEAAFGANGCAHAAAMRLRPEHEPDPDRLRRLGRASLDDARADSRVARAMRSWRECVRRLGFDYRDPFASMSDPRWWTGETTAASRQEIAVAAADVRCKEQTGLVDMWHAAETRVQQKSIKRDARYFQQLSAAKREELAAARAVLAQSNR